VGLEGQALRISQWANLVKESGSREVNKKEKGERRNGRS